MKNSHRNGIALIVGLSALAAVATLPPRLAAGQSGRGRSPGSNTHSPPSPEPGSGES